MCHEGKTEREKGGAAPRLPRGTDWINERGRGWRKEGGGEERKGNSAVSENN